MDVPKIGFPLPRECSFAGGAPLSMKREKAPQLVIASGAKQSHFRTELASSLTFFAMTFSALLSLFRGNIHAPAARP